MVELFFEELDLELEGLGVCALRDGQRRAELRQPFEQAIVLGLEQQRHLAQALDVGLRLDLHAV